MPKLTLFLLFLYCLAGHAQITRFDRDSLREKMIAFKDNPPRQSVRVAGETEDPAKKRFIDFYVSEIFPRLQDYKQMEIRYRAVHTLVDAFLHRSEEERERLAGPGGEFEKVMAEATQWSTDASWTAALKKWAELAEGLEGELPNLARRMATERKLEVFDESLKPMLDEAARLEKDYMIAINETASSRRVAEYRRSMSDITRRFKGGEISFAEARKEMRETLSVMGLHFVGQEAASKAGEKLNQMAVLRAKLAKLKGYRTWAEFALEQSGQGYTPEYRGAANQRAFLERYIAALKPLRDRFVADRIRELGLEDQAGEIRQNHISLLTPPGFEQLRPYFPSNALIDIWEDILMESGFPREILRGLHIDISPREGKNPTAAYMSGFLGPHLNEEVVSVETLGRVLPKKGSAQYNLGFVYILQNFGDSGLNDLEVLFHEGGHGLERLTNYKMDPTDEAYGYVEVPSMTSERFARDPELLWRKARPVNGEKPSLDEIRRLALNEERSSVVDLLSMAKTALYDLNLWDYDYSAPGAMTYMKRVEAVNRDIDGMTNIFPMETTPVPFYYWSVTTSHFISGSVRNIGYTYAEIASRMMSRYFTEELKNSTGQSTWFNQRRLGGLFMDKFFSVGWRTRFPENIEAITGQSFSAEAVVAEMAAQIAAADCEEKLR